MILAGPVHHWVWSSCMEVVLPFRCGQVLVSLCSISTLVFLVLLTSMFWEHLISLARKLLVRGQMGITCLDELAHCWFTIHCWVKIPLFFCFPLQIKLGSFQSVQWGTNLGCFGKDSHEGVCKYYVPWEIHVCIWLPKQHNLLVATLEAFKLFLCVFPFVIYALFLPPHHDFITDIFEFLGSCYIMCFS